ncbi:ankyrin repeat domain-containing protein [Candidatus Cardinium hertigii]|uniref:Uncharacterized protein n=1 Tax=Candidatus Cardinium hertigii TaxID=247481 RepID=A0A2Z3L7E5_9BACT|nr:ankyrin repeat domain-containing protein [Candidatus Cardinium hertigii]AWN81553.1 hypothetical protein DK880_00221 [Candidatus Cardinium hertigii]
MGVPLHFAAQEGKLDCLTALIKGGADVNLKNKNGSAPLHLAEDLVIKIVLIYYRLMEETRSCHLYSSFKMKARCIFPKACNERIGFSLIK